ncbi:MAG TPA: GNAT family N-acetyltransferase [Actinomycetota bacterium]|nr:GNAT family N-acetyltransferase [Actinomycetota bacterium]
MTEAVVRFGRPEDWPEVAALLVELGRGVSPAAAHDDAHRTRFAGHTRALDAVTLVAESEGQVVGFLDMWYQQRLGDHRPQAYVQDLVVTEALRGAGLGSLLLRRAEDLARKRGCFRMWLVTAGWREGTHAFYRTHGWDEYGTWFVKLLQEEEPGRRDD